MKKEIYTTTNEESLHISMAFCDYYQDLRRRVKDKGCYNREGFIALLERLEPLYNTLYDKNNYMARMAHFQFSVQG